MQRYLLWCVYAGSSLEVKIETDSNDAMEIKTEADSNDITECTHHNQSYAAMTGVSDAVFSTFVCLCITCSQCLYFVVCLQYWSSKLNVCFARLVNLENS